MYLSRPDDYLKVFDEKRTSRISTFEAERNIFGFDHMNVGSEILKKWGIPESIYLPIEYHHRGNDCPTQLQNTVEILMLSDMSSSVYHSSKSIEKFGELKQLLQNKLNVSDVEARQFIDSIANKTVEILSTFEIEASSMKPYSQILEEANEELGKLNLSYEQLVMQLKQEKMKVETLAKELKKANEKLRELAIRDDLTSLYNHRYFKELLDREMHRAERYSHVLSLIMIDIDYFKKINDTYGHPQGDITLRSIASLFRRVIRKSDTAARYGGEEFAIILPETDLQGAVSIAERLRKAVEESEIEFEDQHIKVTISLGVTTYDPARNKKTKEEIIDAADRALYNSKQTGRNKLSIVIL